MDVITLSDTAFYELLTKVIEEMEAKFGKTEKQWIGEAEAMELLGIRSKSTLQSLRDHDQIKFTQPRKKIILYHRASLLSFLEAHANK